MSKTNHPRIKGTHQVGHVDRDFKRENQRPGWSVFGETARNIRQAARADITIGLAEIAAPVDLDERWTERECMSEWEYLDEWSVVSGPERMADWEIALLAGIEQEQAASITWSTVTREPSVATFAEADPGRVSEDYDEIEADVLADHWLTGTVDEVFPDGGYIVTGPAASEPSVRASGYLRVHEAAALLECTSASLIHRLRYRGEWVTNAASYVARPVIEAMYAEGLVLFETGELTLADNYVDPLVALRARLMANA